MLKSDENAARTANNNNNDNINSWISTNSSDVLTTSKRNLSFKKSFPARTPATIGTKQDQKLIINHFFSKSRTPNSRNRPPILKQDSVEQPGDELVIEELVLKTTSGGTKSQTKNHVHFTSPLLVYSSSPSVTPSLKINSLPTSSSNKNKIANMVLPLKALSPQVSRSNALNTAPDTNIDPNTHNINRLVKIASSWSLKGRSSSNASGYNDRMTEMTTTTDSKRRMQTRLFLNEEFFDCTSTCDPTHSNLMKKLHSSSCNSSTVHSSRFNYEPSTIVASSRNNRTTTTSTTEANKMSPSLSSKVSSQTSTRRLTPSNYNTKNLNPTASVDQNLDRNVFYKFRNDLGSEKNITRKSQSNQLTSVV